MASNTGNSTEQEPAYVDGFVKKGFEKVRDKFRENLENGSDKGSSFAAYYKGELVVNLWGGWVEKEASQRWREDTMPCFYSATKSPSAIVIAHMVDRGLLKYEDKISKYWKEFGQNGKEDITLETYISNKAGLCVTDEPFPIRLTLDNPQKLGEILAKQKPFWKPGEKHGYHPITFALYLDQIVRRVDPKKRSLAKYFKEEIAKPFDIEFYIGLPKELFYRAPRVSMLKELDIGEVMKGFKGDLKIMQLAMVNHADYTGGTMNDPYIRELPVGSVGGHGTAAALAKFHSILANGGVYEGKRLLSEEAIKRQMVPKSCGPDAALGLDAMWSLGTIVLAAADEEKEPIFSFGYGGFGGQIAIADPTFKVAFAYGTNHLNPMEDKPGKDVRWVQLSNALYECVYKIENRSAKRIVFETYSELKEYQDSLST